jgi:uncharacterized protein YjbI with pentapeptide repeats
MANDEDLARKRQRAAWNDWRAKNPERAVDLRRVDLGGRNLHGPAHLRGVNLGGADLGAPLH